MKFTTLLYIILFLSNSNIGHATNKNPSNFLEKEDIKNISRSAPITSSLKNQQNNQMKESVEPKNSDPILKPDQKNKNCTKPRKNSSITDFFPKKQTALEIESEKENTINNISRLGSSTSSLMTSQDNQTKEPIAAKNSNKPVLKLSIANNNSTKRKSSIDKSPPSKKQNVAEINVVKGDKFSNRFNEVKNKPLAVETLISTSSSFETIVKIGHKDERGKRDEGGSRKWVSFFKVEDSSIETGQQIHDWHQKSAKAVREIYELNIRKNFTARHSNFALARLTYIPLNKTQEVEAPFELPLFFVSGWPADKNNTIKNLAQGIKNKEYGTILEPYCDYGLRFITRSYRGENIDGILPRYINEYHNNNLFVQEIKDVLVQEINHDQRLIAPNRLKTSIKELNDRNTNRLLDELFFHSEQALKRYVKEQIRLKKKSYALKYVILDICSLKDMCWRCGDTLVSCFHNEDLGAKIISRTSGCMEHEDFKNKAGLRNKRDRFSGFLEGKAYEVSPAYKPYVAHARIEDIIIFKQQIINNQNDDILDNDL